mmetsp:Transcript_36731/g.83138  ORF Transcript_36731/g.83138 Transcript_36731/m.83138 type:complete len:83 (+) Transcript_36731:128-376(+)
MKNNGKWYLDLDGTSAASSRGANRLPKTKGRGIPSKGRGIPSKGRGSASKGHGISPKGRGMPRAEGAAGRNRNAQWDWPKDE